MAKNTNNSKNSGGKKGNYTRKDSNPRSGKDPRKNRKNTSRDGRMEESSYGKTAGANDVAWYSNHPQLLKDVASIPYAFPVGKPLTGIAYGAEYTPANIMALDIKPTIGDTVDALSPINVAMRSLHSYVNYANSRNTSYDDTDLMLYVLAMDSAYAYFYHMIRIYGVARLYSQYNKNLPDNLLRAMGVEPQDIRTHLADFRAYINTYAWRLGSFFVPNVFSFMTRHAWLYSNIYLDDTSKKSSMYVFRPDGFYEYDEMTNETGGCLRYVRISDDRTFQDIVSAGDQLIDKLQLAQDIGIIGSDILKAFGESNLIKVSPIAEDYMVLPVYEPEVLEQIRNATIVGPLQYHENDGSIIQMNQHLYATNIVSDSAALMGLKAQNLVLDSKLEDPTPGDTMVATRLMACAETHGGLSHYGSELVVGAVIYDVVGDPAYDYKSYVTLNSPTEAEELLQLIVQASNFRNKPIMHINLDYSDTQCAIGFVGDVTNYTVLPREDLELMHRAALLSMFHVPAYGMMK